MAGPGDDELLRQMARAAEHFDADVERALVRAIASAQLVVPIRADPGSGESRLWATADPEGRTLVVAFTDAEALRTWAGQETPHAVVPGPELARIAVSADAAALWLNPAGPHGGRLERYMVDVVAAGETLAFERGDAAERTLQLTTTGQGELRVRRPAQPPPDEALEGLRDAIAGSPHIADGWLLEATAPPPAHLLLVLALAAGGDGDAAMADVRATASRLGPRTASSTRSRSAPATTSSSPPARASSASRSDGPDARRRWTTGSTLQLSSAPSRSRPGSRARTS